MKNKSHIRKVNSKNLNIKCIVAMIIIMITASSGCVDQSPTEIPTDTSAVSGYVISINGSSIPNVKVTLSMLETFTNEEGYFSLEDIPSGIGKLFLSKEGFVEKGLVVDKPANTSVDMGTIIMYEKHGDIVSIEELLEEDYTPNSDAEILLHYYTERSFDKLGSVRVNYTQGAMYITVLVTAIQNTYILETSGAASITFDFAEELKIIRMRNIVLTMPFGPDAEEYVSIIPQEEIERNHFCRAEGLPEEIYLGNALDVFLITNVKMCASSPLNGEPEWGSEEDYEKFLELFRANKLETNIAAAINESVRKLTSPNIFEKVEGLLEIIPIGIISVVGEFVNLDISADELQGAILRAANGVRYMIIQERNQLMIEKNQKDSDKRKLEDENRALENNRQELENNKQELENSKEILEEGRKYWEERKKKLEDEKQELEKELENSESLPDYELYDPRIEIEQRLGEINIEINEIEERINEIEEKIKGIEEKIKGIEEEIKEIESTIEKNKTSIEAFETRIKEIDQRLDEIEQSIKAIDEIDLNIPKNEKNLLI